MPSISNMISRDSPSMNWKLKFALFGRRFVLWPFSLVYGISCQYAVNQVIAKLCSLSQYAPSSSQLLSCCSLSISDDTRYILRTRTALALLCSAMNERTDFYTLTDVEETDSLRTVQLMSAGAEHIDVALIYIDRHLAISLHCIGVEQNAVFLCDLTDLFDRLNGSDLIVCKHNRDQDRIRTDCFLQFIKLYDTIFIYIKVSDLIAALLQIFTGMQNCMMLDLCGDDVFSFCSDKPLLSLSVPSCQTRNRLP